MYASFDRNSPTPLSGDVLSLSWKGDAGQGWLACGNSRKTVGVTYTELKDEEDLRFGDLFSEREMQDFSLERQGMRRNFNFREHSQEVRSLRWQFCQAVLCVTVIWHVSVNCTECRWEKRPTWLPETHGASGNRVSPRGLCLARVLAVQMACGLPVGQLTAGNVQLSTCLRLCIPVSRPSV